MSTRKTGRSAQRLQRQAGELAAAVPQVVAARLARIALAGASPSPRDRREFSRMGAEKVAAFQESWVAMGSQVMQIQQQAMMAWWRSAMVTWAMPWSALATPRSPISPATAVGQWTRVLSEGMAPVHRRAVANARRLRRRAS